MKRIFQIALASTVLLGAASCGPREVENTETETVEVVEEVSQRREGPEGLSLNNGAKWEVNSEMKEYPLNCQKLIQNYVKTQGTDYRLLADELGGQTKKLIGSCTMNGESHDELHKWLEPNMVLVEELSKANSEAEANTIVEKLQVSYNVYNRYFE